MAYYQKIRDFVLTTNPTNLQEAVNSAKLKESILAASAFSKEVESTTFNLISKIRENDLKGMQEHWLN